MKCPVCKDIDLVMADRQGVEIDYCPQCRGIWLDRGELDKIIERSLGTIGQSQNNQGFREDEHQSSYYDKRHKHRDHGCESHHNKHDVYHDGEYTHSNRKKSFLKDLFDF